MIQNIIWRYVQLDTQADIAFCTKDEFPDYTLLSDGFHFCGFSFNYFHRMSQETK